MSRLEVGVMRAGDRCARLYSDLGSGVRMLLGGCLGVVSS